MALSKKQRQSLTDLRTQASQLNDKERESYLQIGLKFMAKNNGGK